MSITSDRPRFLPQEPLPPYSYVPGQLPHPRSHSGGQSRGESPASIASFDPSQWRQSWLFLRGFDLFNCGYFWEAHELWECLWHACGRNGRTAEVLKGLIKLAAAGVKVRQGKPIGVVDHAQRAADIFDRLRRSDPPSGRFMGLDLAELQAWAKDLASRAELLVRDHADDSRFVFPLIIRPRDP